MAEFLLEIGLEEIPARMIAGAEAELGRRVSELLTRERLLSAEGKVTTYSTPRRLAVQVEGLAVAQADTEEQLTGPSWKIAFPNGEAGPAALAFAKKAGVEISALEKITNSKGEYPVERPLKPEDLWATVYRHLGIDWTDTFADHSGRPQYILPDAKPIAELLPRA